MFGVMYEISATMVGCCRIDSAYRGCGRRLRAGGNSANQRACNKRPSEGGRAGW